MKTQSLFTVLVLVAVAICTSATPALASGPAAGVSASPTTITNEGQEATFTLTLSSPAPRMLALNFVMTGSAIDGDDYILLGNFNESGGVVFSPGQSTATVTLHSFSNDRPGPHRRTAILNILNGNGYRRGSPSHAQVAILVQL